MPSTSVTVPDFATVVAGVAAALGLVESVRRVTARTIGRRIDLARRFRRLGTGAQIQFFESVLGEPPAIRRRFERDLPDWTAVEDWDREPPRVTRSFVECFFIDP